MDGRFGAAVLKFCVNVRLGAWSLMKAFCAKHSFDESRHAGRPSAEHVPIASVGLAHWSGSEPSRHRPGNPRKYTSPDTKSTRPSPSASNNIVPVAERRSEKA